MKKKLTRMLAVVLIAMMLIPTLGTLAVSAEKKANNESDISDIKNVFAINGSNAAPSKSSKDAETTVEEGMIASKPFELTTLDDMYLYVGPCADPRVQANWKALDYIAYWYKPSGAYTSQKKFSELGNGDETNGYPNIVGEFPDGSVILKIKLKEQKGKSSDQKYAALKLLDSSYNDYILATVERPFTVDEYYAYADTQGWDIESVGLRPSIADQKPAGYEGLWNFFPRVGDRDPFLRQHQNNNYIMSEYIPVVPGDVVTMGAIDTKESRSILYAYDADFNQIRQYKRTDMEIKYEENIGYDFAIYSFTVPQKSEANPDAKEIAYVKVSVHSGIYNDGDILVTKNQPFTGAQLRAALGIAELSDEAKAHPFYGKNALFVGDSISYGSYDTPPTYRNPSASWARRLALATGLVPTNKSYPGASVGKTGLSNVKWEYDLLNEALMSKRNFQIVVFQGGVNDARQSVPVGEALPGDTDRKILVQNERVATFAGGLQLMFKDATDKWPEAEFYYIANFKLVDDSVKGKDMAEYFAQAKILCAEYGIQYIDLYNDVELYETFDYESKDILPDLIHPTSSSYDILFPAVLRLFNEAHAELEANNSTTDSPCGDSGVTESEHTCEEVNAIVAFFINIINFFRRLFGMPELCSCGKFIKG